MLLAAQHRAIRPKATCFAGRKKVAFCFCHTIPPPAGEPSHLPCRQGQRLEFQPHPSIRLAKTDFKAWLPSLISYLRQGN